MAEEILQIVDEYGDITIPGIMERLRSRDFDPDGSGIMKLSGVENVYTWMGVSLEFHNSLNELIENKLIVAQQCDIMIFMIDGVPMLNLPIVSGKIPKNGYKKPRWVPLSYTRN